MVNKEDGYRKTYRLRVAATGKKTIEVTFPFEVVEKEARNTYPKLPAKAAITTFLQEYHAVAFYNGFDGVHYSFEKIARWIIVLFVTLSTTFYY